MKNLLVFFTTKALSYNIWAMKVCRHAFRSRWSLVVGRWSLVVGRWSAHLAIRTHGAADKYLT
jgi:hypothetical protein